MKIKTTITVLSIILLLSFSKLALAAPSIGSVSETSGVITITGTGFTNHADESGASYPYLISAWDDMETGTLESTYSNMVKDSSWPDAVHIGTTNQRANSTYTLVKEYNPAQAYPRLGAYVHNPPNGSNTVYVSFWFRTDSSSSSGKYFRVWSDDDDNSPTPNVYFSTDGSNTNLRGHAEYCTPTADTVTSSPDAIGGGTWHKTEYYIEAGGNLYTYIDGKLQWTRDWFAWDSTLDWGGHYRGVQFGAMIDDASGDYHYDDLYVSLTRARVEICDVGGTWGDGTTRKCETQIPTSWTTTSIEVTANNGAFSENDTAYLYVIDEDGVASSAEVVTIGSGGSSDTTNPTLSSATVDSSGVELDAVFDEGVTTSGYTTGDFTLTCTTANGGTAFDLSSPSGSGTTWSFSTGAVTVNSGDSCTISYNGATDGIEDASGNDLLTIPSMSVTVVGYTADTTNPTLSSATVDSSGTEVDLVFDETVVTGGYTSGDLTITCTTANGGSPISLSSPSGSGTAWSLSTGAITVNSGDSCTLAYNGASNGIEDSSGNDLLTIPSMSVTVVGYTAPTIPDVTNVSQSDGELVITGTDLGSHSDFSSSTSTTLARAWNDFEGGTVLKDDWQHAYSGSYSANWQALTGATNRANSTYYAARNNSVHIEGALEISTTTQPTEWYASMYLQISDTCPTSVPQGQIMRIWGDSSESMYLEVDGSSNYLSGTFTNIGGAEIGTVESIGTNTWHRVEMYMNKTSQEVSTYIDGKLQWTRNDWPSATFQAQNHTWDIGEYVEQVADTCYQRFDDVYFDHTPARVEICETGGAWSTAATKHCEVQIPTSWASDSITVTANHGTFAVNDSVYLYVIDSNGNASDPYSITLTDIGGGEPATPQGSFSDFGSGFGSIGVGTGSFQ